MASTIVSVWDEFKQQFYDTVVRGVFRRLTVKEMGNFYGPVHYITMVESHSRTGLTLQCSYGVVLTSA
jgi:hypothetical protein